MTPTTAMNLDQARFNMIEQQVRPWEVLDPAVLGLLESVKRERFVSAAHQALAYVDMELPLGQGADQVMLAPRVQARLVQDLALKPTDRVLEIGTGSGFTTALLASLAQRVVSLEIDAAVAQQARERLQQAGFSNAEVPAALLQLLAPGGRLVTIVGHEPVMRATVVTRVGEARFQTAQPWDTVAPRLRNFGEPSRFHF
jgi:protein-L-isoaspartate(D-aspartate) O-methyltransferase